MFKATSANISFCHLSAPPHKYQYNNQLTTTMDGMPFQLLREVPVVTRAYMIASIGLSIAETMGYIKIQDFIVKPDSLIDINQLWKVPLNLVYNGPLSLDSFAKLYFFTRSSQWLETSQTSTSYLWMIFILTILLNIYSISVSNMGMLSPPLTDALLYICTKKNPGMWAMFIFIPVEGEWLPWINTLTNVAFSKNPDKRKWLYNLAGIAVGHTYWFIDEQIPILHKSKSIFTPIWQWNVFHNHPMEAPAIADEPVAQEQEQEQEQEQPEVPVEPTPMIEIPAASNASITTAATQGATEDTLHQRN